MIFGHMYPSIEHIKVCKFPILDGDVFALHPMESISLNSFVLLEHLAILLTSILTKNC